ncbi:hypothetical protein GC194_11405 [bacterium]|nr:hypothetical protein [bacterium]
MRNFLFLLLKILGAFVVLNVLTYFLVTKDLLFTKYEESKDEIEIIKSCHSFILSDSHGWRLTEGKSDLKKKLEDNGIYNFSYGSDALEDILIKLEWLKKKNIQVDHIYLTFDDHMYTKQSNNAEKVLSYSSYDDYKNTYGLKEFIKNNVVKYIPLLYPSNQQLIKHSFFSLFNFSDETDQTTGDHQWAMLDDSIRYFRTKDRISSFVKGKNQEVSSQKLKTLKRIVGHCNKENIEILAIRFPVSPFLNDLFAEYGIYDRGYDYIKKYSINKVLDYEKSYSQPKFLSNQDHVNRLGAQKIVSDLIEFNSKLEKKK